MKTFNGIVISSRMDKTAVVEITRRTPHPLYRKLIKKTKRYKVDTEGKEVVVGTQVVIVQTRPVAKGKHFRILFGENKAEEKK